MARTYDSNNKSVDFFYNILPHFITSQVHSLTLGRVTKYDKDKHTCDVQPLVKDSDNDKRPVLIDCLVPSSIWQTDNFINKICKNQNINMDGYKSMKVGSIVVTGFFDDDMDKYSGKKDAFKPESSRHHSINDAFILEVMQP